MIFARRRLQRRRRTCVYYDTDGGSGGHALQTTGTLSPHALRAMSRMWKGDSTGSAPVSRLGGDGRGRKGNMWTTADFSTSRKRASFLKAVRTSRPPADVREKAACAAAPSVVNTTPKVSTPMRQAAAIPRDNITHQTTPYTGRFRQGHRMSVYVFNFGAHRGETLVEVLEHAPEYIRWIVRTGVADAKGNERLRVALVKNNVIARAPTTAVPSALRSAARSAASPTGPAHPAWEGDIKGEGIIRWVKATSRKATRTPNHNLRLVLAHALTRETIGVFACAWSHACCVLCMCVCVRRGGGGGGGGVGISCKYHS